MQQPAFNNPRKLRFFTGFVIKFILKIVFKNWGEKSICYLISFPFLKRCPLKFPLGRKLSKAFLRCQVNGHKDSFEKSPSKFNYQLYAWGFSERKLCNESFVFSRWWRSRFFCDINVCVYVCGKEKER